MITHISIRDFVLIERLDTQPGDGFTALTGETGAGKSIILDAIGLCLGWPADRRYVKAGREQASIAVEVAPPAQHIIWDALAEHDIAADRSESVTFKRVIKSAGPSRALINDQPVSARALAAIGETLIEIHGQHADSALMRPSHHRKLLDQFAGNEKRLAKVKTAWDTLADARTLLESLEAEAQQSAEDIEWLSHAVEELGTLGPAKGEAEKLAATRARLMQSERVTEAVDEGLTALSEAGVEDALARAARCAERICRLPGFEAEDAALPAAARAASDALERALIEAQEAAASLQGLESMAVHDGAALEAAEARLFALRAAARKHAVDVDALPETLEALATRLSRITNGDEALDAARIAAAHAFEAWSSAAGDLTKARIAAAKKLSKSIETELAPLKLGQVKVGVAVTPLAEGQSGAGGADHVEFEVQTNPGAAFGPLRQIASGGELARFSLALKCALAETGTTRTLIFDEADQGVGGAVAAAIGERLTRLAARRQVFAITHSPQVAASGTAQWLIEKGVSAKSKAGGWTLSGLDDGERLEEIARMLSGRAVTAEARAAAGRLLEEA